MTSTRDEAEDMIVDEEPVNVLLWMRL